MMWSLLVLSCSVAAGDGDSGVSPVEPPTEVTEEPEPAPVQQQADPWAILLEQVQTLPEPMIEPPQEAPPLPAESEE